MYVSHSPNHLAESFKRKEAERARNEKMCKSKIRAEYTHSLFNDFVQRLYVWRIISLFIYLFIYSLIYLFCT